MRAYEWTQEDLTWLELIGEPLDINDDYNTIVEVINFLIKQKSAHRIKQMLPNIEEFEAKLYERTQVVFVEPTDPDAVKFIDDAKNMLEHIKSLKNQLINI